MIHKITIEQAIEILEKDGQIDHWYNVIYELKEWPKYNQQYPEYKLFIWFDDDPDYKDQVVGIRLVGENSISETRFIELQGKNGEWEMFHFRINEPDEQFITPYKE